MIQLRIIINLFSDYLRCVKGRESSVGRVSLCWSSSATPRFEPSSLTTEAQGFNRLATGTTEETTSQPLPLAYEPEKGETRPALDSLLMKYLK